MSDKVIKAEYLNKVASLNGKLHRENGPAVEWIDGHKEWYLHGKLHREDGPAVVLGNGNKYWFLNGVCHREDGPAVEYVDGTKQYWVNGERLDFITSDQMLVYYLKYDFLK